MDKAMTVLLCVLFGMVIPTLAYSSKEIEEYCMFDTFSPTCDLGEVIVMVHAVYGRMQVGKCLKNDYQLGCAADLLDMADKLCSGKRNCQISVPNPEMTEALTCLEDRSISPYLEAGYECKPVYKPHRQHCTSPERISLSKETMLLSSTVTRETSCGLHDAQWLLEADPGQQIEILIQDFSWSNETVGGGSIPSRCALNYGYVLDVMSDDLYTMCGGSSRERLLHTSHSHSVQIVLQESALTDNNFILKVSAIGCPDYKPPDHMWTEKENNTLVVHCQSSESTWRLTCINNMWLGNLGNCTSPTTPKPQQKDNVISQKEMPVENTFHLPLVEKNHVIAFTLGCVTLMVCCIIVVLGIYCTKRYEVDKKRSTTKSHPLFCTNLRSPHHNLLAYRPVQDSTIQGDTTTLDLPPYSQALPRESRPPRVSRRTLSYGGNGTLVTSRDSDYLNPCPGSGETAREGEESVQYFILENPADIPGSEQMYQSIHLENGELMG